MTKNKIPIYGLGDDFYDPVLPARFPKAILRYKNQSAVDFLNLNQLDEEEFKSHFWDFKALPNNVKSPLALRYHGHQFGHYNPELGDGRGFLYAQFLKNNTLYDLGTKGSGQTPYSRRGDGRLTLKGAMREALATELLESLGVNTSKTFSFFETGENLERNDEPSPTRSAVLVRLTQGHVRIGTFQRLHYFEQKENIRKLTLYCIKYFYSEILQKEFSQLNSLDVLKEDQMAELVQNFFLNVIQRNADLVASLMMSGFVHGVLNTDNINVSGELFDYGPYRFLPKYDPHFTAAYFDQSGFYCFGRQPMSFAWNLEQLGSSLHLAFPELDVQRLLSSFEQEFNSSLLKYFFKRLNLKPKDTESDISLMKSFFQFLSQTDVLFEQSFFDFWGGVDEIRLGNSPQSKQYLTPHAEDLKLKLKKFEVANKKLVEHFYFQKKTPETLLINEIEEIWDNIDKNDDWSKFNIKLEAIRRFRGVYK